MLAAFAMHSITGGPQFIRERTDVVYAIIIASFGQAFLLFALGLACIPLLANVVKVPINYAVPSVLALSVFGVRCSVFGVRCFRSDRRPFGASDCFDLLDHRMDISTFRLLSAGGGNWPIAGRYGGKPAHLLVPD